MAEDINDIFEEEVDADGHIPQGCQDAQAMLDSFVEINYQTALDAASMHVGGIDANHIRQQTVDILRPISEPSYRNDAGDLSPPIDKN